MHSFAACLNALRESRDLKKKDLAQILNVSPSCICQYEKGDTIPSYDTLCRISQYFGVSIDYLMGNDLSTLPVRLEDSFSADTTYLALLQACSNIPEKNRAALLSVISALQK